MLHGVWITRRESESCSGGAGVSLREEFRESRLPIYNPADGSFFLKNTHAGGTADITFQFGAGGGQPVAGDWNGDGTDTIGFMTPTGTWYLRNANAGGAADYTFSFGAGGMPVAGDWDGTPTAGSSWTQDYNHDRRITGDSLPSR